MAIIPQKQLFSWKEIENPGDLSRLRLVLDYLSDGWNNAVFIAE